MANLETSTGIEDHKVVSQEEWIAARKSYSRGECSFTHRRDKHSGDVAKVPRMSSSLRLRLGPELGFRYQPQRYLRMFLILCPWRA